MEPVNGVANSSPSGSSGFRRHLDDRTPRAMHARGVRVPETLPISVPFLLNRVEGIEISAF